ncbi:MAG TPA: acyl-CoA synthetase [Gammaproteobacteria bacterium]|nr:acyl-CoA synthetase [Pseudomonadales bacterium]MEC8810497.1 AMP-binding protein [Pseudomonadota bacterium]HAG95114.1 acyl-CoA synthetase [Gammaproteobacteria bacterium]|tara:strand:- start:6668 stop:8209 length:1542 start_codon:yes stop_codon:yes gene_type:complete
MNELHRPLYAPDLLVNALNQDARRPLLEVPGGERLTVGDMRDSTSQYVQALAALGLGKGSRIGLLSSNRPEVLVVANAIQVTAAAYVPLHPMAGVSDHLYVVSDANIDVLIFDAKYYGERAQALLDQIPGLQLLAFGSSPIAQDLIKMASRFVPAELVAPRVSENDILRLGYSGGTTGKPKALASVQRTGMATVTIMMAEWEWPSSLRFLSCTPLSHAGAAMFLPTLLRGGTMLVLPAFNPLEVMQTIQDYRINCVLMVPTMIYSLLDHPRFDEFDLSSLETVFYGASAISPSRLREAIERIGPVFMQFYGQAEAPMAVTVLRKHEHDINNTQRLASCGRPVPWLHVALLDADCQPVPLGEPGEICVRGPLVMNGYRDNPELTAEATAGDWLHSGDVAVQDSDGYLRIIDRIKDMIVTGGFNVYPREVENILAEHPAVSQVAVIGVPDEKWGEAVKALVVLKQGHAVEGSDLIERVSSLKGSFQAPKSVEFVDVIPLTAVGKPDKKALRSLYQ